MGNRPCAALCYEVDHSKSVNESTSVVNKSSALWAKHLAADFEDDDDDEAHHNSYSNNSSVRRGGSSISNKRPQETCTALALAPLRTTQQPSPPLNNGVHNLSSPTPSPPRNLQQLQQQQHATTVEAHPAYYYTGFPTDVRSMSSETCGREARSEHNLSRRSSSTTCEREEIQDEVCENRSS